MVFGEHHVRREQGDEQESQDEFSGTSATETRLCFRLRVSGVWSPSRSRIRARQSRSWHYTWSSPERQVSVRIITRDQTTCIWSRVRRATHGRPHPTASDYSSSSDCSPRAALAAVTIFSCCAWGTMS